MSEGMLRDLVDCGVGTEIISSHIPLTLTARSIEDLEETRESAVMGQ
jgi:hypothetical protein